MSPWAELWPPAPTLEGSGAWLSLLAGEQPCLVFPVSFPFISHHLPQGHPWRNMGLTLFSLVAGA